LIEEVDLPVWARSPYQSGKGIDDAADLHFRPLTDAAKQVYATSWDYVDHILVWSMARTAVRSIPFGSPRMLRGHSYCENRSQGIGDTIVQ
jgi:hypothetical protein